MIRSSEKSKPFPESPPGDTIKEHIDYIGMSELELADRLGLTLDQIESLLIGRMSIDTTLADKLEQALGIPSSFWINRERGYRNP